MNDYTSFSPDDSQFCELISTFEKLAEIQDKVWFRIAFERTQKKSGLRLLQLQAQGKVLRNQQKRIIQRYQRFETLVRMQQGGAA